MPATNTALRERPGRCPTHGDVRAVKTIPTFKFPLVITFLVRRSLSAFKPYHCPECGAKAA